MRPARGGRPSLRARRRHARPPAPARGSTWQVPRSARRPDQRRQARLVPGDAGEGGDVGVGLEAGEIEVEGLLAEALERGDSERSPGGAGALADIDELRPRRHRGGPAARRRGRPSASRGRAVGRAPDRGGRRRGGARSPGPAPAASARKGWSSSSMRTRPPATRGASGVSRLLASREPAASPQSSRARPIVVCRG